MPTKTPNAIKTNTQWSCFEVAEFMLNQCLTGLLGLGSLSWVGGEVRSGASNPNTIIK